jgi:DNA invertase Pin-like site-specific DNA recombinase
MGKFMFTVLAAIAEFELDLIKERVREGVAAARRRRTGWGPKRVMVDEKLSAALDMQKRGIPTAGDRSGARCRTCDPLPVG